MRVRPHLIVCGVALATLGNAKDKAPPVPLPTAKEAPAGAGLAKLSSPLDQQILLAPGRFTRGSSMKELAAAIALCQQEVLGPVACDPLKVTAPFVYETAPHTVYLDAFHLDRTEVTVAAYRRCVVAGDCASPTFPAGDARFDRDDLPVTHVSHADAEKFCAFRKGRLPTEAEWERAARGLSETDALGKELRERVFPWGNLANGKLANHGALDLGTVFLVQTGEPLLGIADVSDGFAGLAPVGSFPNGATPEGILDLAGNVSEWVADIWGDQYASAPVGNPKGPPSGTLRVVRGGSYRHPMHMTRGASRDRRPPSAREPYIGFRCARDAT